MFWQIAWEGYIKDIESDKVNLLRVLGCKINDGVFEPSFLSSIFGWGFRLPTIIIGLAILFVTGGELIAWLGFAALLASILYSSNKLVKKRRYNHGEIVMYCAVTEVLVSWPLVVPESTIKLYMAPRSISNYGYTEGCLRVVSFEGAIESPKNEYRPLMAFGWNAKLDHNRLIEQIDWLKEAGYGGFLIEAWAGLPNQVMDEAWIDAVETAVKRAEQNGLEVWIWDDWTFPSGFGGGLVTADPAFRARRLHITYDVILEPRQSISLVAPERTVAAGVIPINKYVFFGPAGDWKPLSVKPGERISYTAGNRRERFLLVTWEYYSFHQFAVTGNDPDDPRVCTGDMLNRRATQRFLEVIHERYAERLSPFFGKTLKGFYYDEPELPYWYPWTEDFPEQFKVRKGYDLRDFLPLIMAYLPNWYMGLGGQKNVRVVESLANDYFDVWTDLTAENFYAEIERWCHEHGILSIGHQDMDHRTHNLGTVSGHFFKNSTHNDYPGIDVIWEQIARDRFIDFPRFAGSAARVLGKRRAMTETLAGMGYGMSINDIRYVLEHQIIRGVTKIFLDHMPYDEKRRWSILEPHVPPLLSTRNPMIASFSPILNERIGRLSTLVNVGISSVEVLLYVPMYDINLNQVRMANPWAGNKFWMPWEMTNRIAEHLTYLPCEFDYVWDEALLSLEVTEGGFKSKAGHTYRILILPSSLSCTLKPVVVDRLRAFCAKGGKLLVCERPVKEVDDLAILCPAINDLDKHLPRRVKIEPNARISVTGRIDGRCEIYLLLNEESVSRECTLEFSGQGRLLEMDPNDGSMVLVAEKEPLRVARRFDGTALRVFVIDRAGELAAKPEPTPAGAPVRLYGWKLILPSGRTVAIEKEFPEWREVGFPTYSGWLTYTVDFQWPYSISTAKLDLGEVCHAALVFLDGKKVAESPFRPHQVTVSGLTAREHRLDIRVLNTFANENCGTREREKELYGDLLPDSLTWDRRKTRSGLFGPVTLTPLKSQPESPC